MASSSSYGSRYSRKKGELSTVQVKPVNEPVNVRKSRKNPNDSSIPGVKNGGVSRRRSAPSVRCSKTSQTQTTSQRSRSGLGRHIIGINDEDEDDNEHDDIDGLNISSASTITENMEILQQDDNDHPTASINNNNNNNNEKTTIKKHELLNQYFTKLNTGGYYCKLCDGTKNSTKVHKQVPYSDANLRSHLARQHQLKHVLYPSQRLKYQAQSQVLSADFKKN